MKGDNTTNQAGVYGTNGMAAAANKPGARVSSVSWTDASGHLWLFGGYGYATSTLGTLNDLWKYNSSTGEWMWRKVIISLTNQEYMEQRAPQRQATSREEDMVL
jgi:N-acetylneuraminic acid mutarotase